MYSVKIRMKAASKINLITILIIVFALSVVIYMALDLQARNRDKLESMFQRNQQNIALQVSHRIESFLDDESQHLILLSEEIASAKSVLQISKEEATKIEESLPHLSKRHIKLVSIYDKNGTEIYSSQKNALGLSNSESDILRWVSRHANNNPVYFNESMKNDSVKNVEHSYHGLLMITPIYHPTQKIDENNSTKEVEGFIVSLIDRDELLSDLLSFTNIDGGVYKQDLWVMSNDGRLLYFPAHKEMQFNSIRNVSGECFKCHNTFDYINTIFNEKAGTLDYQLKDRNKKLAAFSTIKFGNLTWKVIVSSPYNQISSFTTNNSIQTIALIGIVVLILAVGFVLVRKNHDSRIRAEEEIKQLREKEALRKEAGLSEEKFRILAEESPNMIFINKEGRIVYANKKCVEVMGYTIEEFYNPEFSFLNLIGQEYVDLVRETYSKRFSEGAKSSYEYALITKNGKRLDAIITASVIDYENGKAMLGTVTDISERKKAEAALTQSEKRYRTLFENAPVGIAMLDENNRVLQVNKGFEELFQYTFNEIKGSFIDDFIVPEENKVEAHALSLESQAGRIAEKETIRKRKDGTKILVQVYGVPITVNNKCTGIYGMYVDITERKRSEQRITEALKFNAKILQASPVGIIAYKKGGEAVSANEASAKIVGAQLEQIVNQNFRELKSWKESGLFDAAVKVLETKIGISLDAHFVTTFGKETWISCRFEPFNYESEEHLLLIFEDVSQRIQSEQENRMLAHAIESVSECVSITDHNDTLIFVNDSFVKTYGYRVEELIGQHVSILRPKNISQKTVETILPETIRGGWKGEVVNCKKDGTVFPVLLSTSVIKDDLGKPIALIGVATDITEAKKSREELILAKELAEKSAQLKAEFLAQMSHEIRSPMNVALNFTHMLKEEVEDRTTPEMLEYFEGIELSGKRLIRTVDLILNASEMQVGTYEPIWGTVNLSEDVFKSIYSEYASYAKRKGLELNIISKAADSKIKGDRYSILQIFANLVDNAIKYAHSGNVDVIIDRNENNRVRVDVIDTGIGMSEEFMKRIFQPFMQEDRGYSRKYEGNGLGLSLVKKYCELNEADINVSSEKGKGSKFTVTFPKA